MIGKLIGVGVGPGDPELLTLKAIRLVQHTGILAYTVDTSGNNYARDTVQSYLREGLVEMPLPLLVSANREEQLQKRQENARKVFRFLEQGKDVVFVSEGHPLLYSTFAHLLAEMPAEVRVEVCPGVSAMDAAAADAAFPLANEQQQMMVVPARQALGKLEDWLAKGRVLVLFKVAHSIEAITEELKHCSIPVEAALVERASTDRGSFTRQIEKWTERDTPYFSLILIRPLET